MRPSGVALVLLVTILALLGWAPLGTFGAAPTSLGHRAPRLETDAVPVPAGARDRPMAAGEPIRLEVTLLPRNVDQLLELDAAVSDPSGPQFEHFLTEAEYERSFGPTVQSVATVRAYFAGFGASAFSVTADRLGISMVVPASGVDRALGLTLVDYATGHGPTLYTALGDPTVPSSLAGLVGGVSGLTDAPDRPPSASLSEVASPKPLSRADPSQFVRNSSTGENWFIGSDFTQAYGVTGLFPGTSDAGIGQPMFPTHEAVATILLSGYNGTTGQDLPPWDPSVVSQYFNDTFPTSWPRPTIEGVPVTVDGVTPPAPGPLIDNDTSADEIENSLDLEMAGSLAPGATIVNFYFAASVFENSSLSNFGPIASDFATCLSQALSATYTNNTTLVAVTNSYGLPDLTDPLWDTELLHAAAIGVTVVAASGDQGDAPPSLSGRLQGQWPSWPATAAFNSSGTMAVGGTSIQLSGSSTGTYPGPNGSLPDTFDPGAGTIGSQTVWYDTLGENLSGSEGGASLVTPEPYWQLHSAAQPNIVNMSVAQGASGLGRSEPDLSFVANDTIAYVSFYQGNTYFAVLEGTSIAAPLFAGLLASVAGVIGHGLGYMDPELYRMASYFAQFASPPVEDPFMDVTQGTNYVFSAGPGWDGATGWGGLWAPSFVSALANATIANYTYAGPTPGLPPPSSTSPGNPNTVLFLILLIVFLLVALVVSVVLFSGRRRPRGPTYVPPGAGGVPYAYSPYYGGPSYGAPNYPATSSPYPPSSSSPYAPPTGYPYPSPYGPPPTGSPYAPPPPGAPPSPAPAPATFLCPYCGHLRLAEPGRCGSCGAF
jgi:subtilase family serine protease